ncbi:hypothetical protein [Denitratisoma oestradiolicum]|uniref:Uncharacterized protein n=1 Tax=Denitratisoma oestradiolicum TaxID=311182 RepID=A0A6S6XNN0_9PROT|nr:hypothetical protein [Denitratisoma oestradiolicum]TWO78915.1 hypothetical protein CBW56_17595 [Denitratisoma oestradiolicum]CAB1367541.1 conserved exported protein of unknown function [Denitratisoma oestradiolicum]
MTNGKRLRLALLVSGILVVTSAFAREPSVIFAVRDYTHSGITTSASGQNVRFLMEPLAYVRNGKPTSLPDSQDQKQFESDYYANRPQYTLYIGGKVSGTAKVVQPAFEIQCDSLAAVAQVNPPGLVHGMRMGLASNGDFKATQYARRAPTDEERGVALQFARRIYSKNQVPGFAARRMRLSNLTVFEGATESLLIGSFVASYPRREADYDLWVTHAAFFVAEKAVDALYKPTLTWFHTGEEASVETQDLVDILDIDGDGVPEIITQFGYYEAVEYHVYRKAKGKWGDFYKQFGAGC